MATYTRVNLRDAVMHDLGVLDANEAPAAEDAVLVDRKVQQALELLADEGLIPFDLDGNEIPARYMGPLVAYIAPTVAPAFGLADRMQMLMALSAEGMKSLRRLKAKPYFGTPAQAVYF